MAFPEELKEAFVAFDIYVQTFKGTLAAAGKSGGGGEESAKAWAEMTQLTNQFSDGFKRLGQVAAPETLDKLLNGRSLVDLHPCDTPHHPSSECVS